MASYQDIDSRLRVIEDKVDLMMRLAQVTKQEPSTLMPGQMVTTRLSMLDLYRELKARGEDIERVEEEKEDGATE